MDYGLRKVMLSFKMVESLFTSEATKKFKTDIYQKANFFSFGLKKKKPLYKTKRKGYLDLQLVSSFRCISRKTIHFQFDDFCRLQCN